MPTLKLSGEEGEWVAYQFRASGPIERESGEQEEVSGHEITGKVGPGVDEIPFSGVPMDFAADKPWSLDIELSFGGEFTPFVPTYLNAAVVDIRAKGNGAHYLMSVPEPGMILKNEGREHDGVLDDPNTLVAGNVTSGVDSWVVWPPINLSGVADHPAEYRVRNDQSGDEWRDLAVCRPAMDF